MGGPGETLDALVALVGPVARVNPLVFIKVSVPVKAFPTRVAFVRLLAPVNPLVGL